MRKLTKQEAIRLHCDMWNWIADETEKTERLIDKANYFEAIGVPHKDRPNCDCYCCEYAKQQSGRWRTKSCEHCPLNWESENDKCMCCSKEVLFDGEGLLVRWEDANSIEERAALARKIANLETKPYVLF